MRLVLLAVISLTTCAAAAPAESPLAPPKTGPVRVAFVVSDGATLIDTAGPMQVFEDVPSTGDDKFKIFTVSETRKPVKMGDMTIVPEFTFSDAPDADIVVVGAQSGSTAPYLDYVRSMNARGRLMISVCTGVSKFAKAGILDGLQATTHHDYVDDLQTRYPKVHFVRDKAWVHSAPQIYTSGGEGSGIELALHIVELYFDHNVAVQTARNMEYRGPDWQH